MTVRQRTRRGERRLIIEISYRDNSGNLARYRRDAQVQTMSAARAEEQRLLRNVALHGSPFQEEPTQPAKSSSFKEAVESYRLGHLRTLKGTTQKTYDEVIDNLLLPALGCLPLTDVNHSALVQLDAGIKDAGLSAARRAKALCVTRSILGACIRDGQLSSLPNFPRPPKTTRRAVRAPSQLEIRAILRDCSPSSRLPIALAVFTGLRTGEIRGLRWHDVDLARRTLIVRRSVSRGVEDTPKSGHERTVPLNTMLMPLLEKALLNRPEARNEVCLTKDEDPWGEFSLNQAFKRAAKKSGISGYTFHCCRHFFITELFRQGVGAREIQRLAGHASLNTTQKYAHLVEDDSHRAIERLVVTGWQQHA